MSVLSDKIAITDANIEKLCIIAHNAYERTATEVGWITQAGSRRYWPEVPEANKQTMRGALRAVLYYLNDGDEASLEQLLAESTLQPAD